MHSDPPETVKLSREMVQSILQVYAGQEGPKELLALSEVAKGGGKGCFQGISYLLKGQGNVYSIPISQFGAIMGNLESLRLSLETTLAILSTVSAPITLTDAVLVNLFTSSEKTGLEELDFESCVCLLIGEKRLWEIEETYRHYSHYSRVLSSLEIEIPELPYGSSFQTHFQNSLTTILEAIHGIRKAAREFAKELAKELRNSQSGVEALGRGLRATSEYQEQFKEASHYLSKVEEFARKKLRQVRDVMDELAGWDNRHYIFPNPPKFMVI
jgi:hypothetical protein